MPSGRPKALHVGTLFDGLLDCYVLDDERRVVSQRGVIRALTGGAEAGNIDRYLRRLPSRFADLATGPEIEISRPGGGVAKARDAAWLVDLLRAYDEAADAGELHPTQVHLALNARRILRALAGVAIVALIDEATGYEKLRRAAELSFTFRALLLESHTEWNLMWPTEFVAAVCALRAAPAAVVVPGTAPRSAPAPRSRAFAMLDGLAHVAVLDALTEALSGRTSSCTGLVIRSDAAGFQADCPIPASDCPRDCPQAVQRSVVRPRDLAREVPGVSVLLDQLVSHHHVSSDEDTLDVFPWLDGAGEETRRAGPDPTTPPGAACPRTARDSSPSAGTAPAPAALASVRQPCPGVA